MRPRPSVRRFPPSLALALSATVLLLAAGPAAGRQFSTINYCAQVTVQNTPDFTDLDNDGLSEEVEARILQVGAPPIWQGFYDTCPSGLRGSGFPDGLPNLVPCRLYYIPSQWIPPGYGPSLNPYNYTPDTGYVWYKGRVIINCAVLYGKDCGCSGHTADVEPFFIRYIYTGDDPRPRYDPSRWDGTWGWLETIAHQGTIAEKREDGSYRVPGAPSYSSLVSSEKKHGNYLTETRCESFFPFGCSETCSYAYTKNLLYLNAGEPGKPLITNLGQFRSDYAGENPWGTQNFLGGGAGTIKSKLEYTQTVVRYQTGAALSCYDVCDWFLDCRGCANDLWGVYNDCRVGCQTTGMSRWRCRAFPF